MHAFAAAARRAGAEIRTESVVTAIETTGGNVSGVTTSDGRVTADIVALCAGVYSAKLLQPLGLDLPLRTTLVSAVQTVPLPPLLSQVLGVANANFAGRQQVDGRFRLTGGSAPWAGSLDRLDVDAVQPPGRAVWHVLDRAIAVLPGLAGAPILRVWGGLLDMTPDALPVIERSRAVDGLIIAAGFSGHGFCLGPITGQIIRELVEAGRLTFPLEPFQLDRFARMTSTEAAEPTLHG